MMAYSSRIIATLRGWRTRRGVAEIDATSSIASGLRAYVSRHPAAGACLALLLVVLLALRGADMPLSAPTADQSQYLAYAYNMVTRGKFSAGWGNSTKPDQRREPGYPLLLGAAMLIHPGFELGSITRRCVADREPGCVNALNGLKVVNVLFLGLSGLAAFAAVLALTGSALLAWLGLLWVMLSVSYGSFAVRFFPEVVVGFLLVLLSMRLRRLAMVPPERPAWFVTGLLLGAVVMLKATFYYLAPLLALALAGHAALRLAVRWREAALLGLIFLAGTLVLTVPWQVRNAISTGTTDLAGRAGLVLTVRANYNELSPTEMLAAAAVFSPAHTGLEGFFAERWLTPEIEAMLTGPDNPRARGYTRQGELAAPHRYSAYDSELDELLKQEALARIRADLPAHLRGTLLFGYRGLFVDRGLGFLPVQAADEVTAPRLGTRLFGFTPGGWLFSSPVLINLLLYLPALAAFAFCVVTARWPLVFLMLPAAYLYAIQAFMTHFIPRYGVALIPMLVVIAMLTVSAIWTRLSAWASR